MRSFALTMIDLLRNGVAVSLCASGFMTHRVSATSADQAEPSGDARGGAAIGHISIRYDPIPLCSMCILHLVLVGPIRSKRYTQYDIKTGCHLNGSSPARVPEKLHREELAQPRHVAGVIGRSYAALGVRLATVVRKHINRVISPTRLRHRRTRATASSERLTWGNVSMSWRSWFGRY